MSNEVGNMVRVLGPEHGQTSQLDNGFNRFMVDSASTEGRLSIVEHRIPVGTLAGPMHIHTREDEYSYVLQGRVGAAFGDEVIFAEKGDFVSKPRNEWHTFWNAGDEELCILEIITPGGLEEMFKQFGERIAKYGPESLPEFAAEFGAEVDFAATEALVERYDLKF